VTRIFVVALVGVGATVCIDLWSLLLKRAFGIRSLDYCLLGRWLLHMPKRRFLHANIATSSSKSHECTVGWTAHYSIGIGFAFLFILLAPATWIERPTLLPALAFGVATVIVPFMTVQPSFGLGFAASKTPHPNGARLKSLATHGVFGLGLYFTAWLLAHAA
jgi:hypothetical protein